MEGKKPTWLNLRNYYTDLYTVMEYNYKRPMPGIYTSLKACAKAIYEDIYENSPTEDELIEIVDALDEDGEYETETGFAYAVEVNNVWDIM